MTSLRRPPSDGLRFCWKVIGLKLKGILAALLIAACSFTALPRPAEAWSVETPAPIERGLEYVRGISWREAAAHISAFTGILYWLFSETEDAAPEGDEDISFSDLLELFRSLPFFDEENKPELDPNAPGSYSL